LSSTAQLTRRAARRARGPHCRGTQAVADVGASQATPQAARDL